MKIIHVLLVVGVIVALIAAFFALNNYIYNEKQADEGVNNAVGMNVEFEAVVDTVDLSQISVDGPALINFMSPVGEMHTIAIPSMGLSLCAAHEQIDTVHKIEVGDAIAVRGALNEEGHIVPCEDTSHYFRIGAGVYIDPVLGFEFMYDKGKDGYVFATTDITSADPTFLGGVQLMQYEDFIELEQTTEPREGPPTIAVRVYENTDNRSAALWVDDNPDESNSDLALGVAEEVVVGGANAVRYTVDGLYPTQTYVVAHGGDIYVITGSYLDEDSEIYRDFQSLLASFVFIPIPSQMEEGESIPQE